jgi:hypothetical protein
MREITSTRKHDDETRELKCPIDELECSSDETGVLKCPFRRHERTHVGSQGRFHEEKESTGVVPEVRENTCRSPQGRYRSPVGRGWNGGRDETYCDRIGVWRMKPDVNEAWCGSGCGGRPLG